MAWSVSLGEQRSRTSIQEQYRGSLSRGISAPARGSGLEDIMLWWRPEHASVFGYEDGWTADGGAFYFTGLGQEGDQSFDAPYQENGRLRDHVINGDRVRLLRYVGKNAVRYVGELRLDGLEPWQWRDAVDRRGTTRKAIQFRLVPIGPVLRDADDPTHMEASAAAFRCSVDEMIESVDRSIAAVSTQVEGLNSATVRRVIVAKDLWAKRLELELVHEFADWLGETHGLVATGLRIPYKAEGRDLRADLYVPVLQLLIEAKSTSAREAVRLAIGQLFDYRRWLDPEPRICLLVPTELPRDMLDLLSQLGIAVLWRGRRGFSCAPVDLLPT